MAINASSISTSNTLVIRMIIAGNFFKNVTAFIRPSIKLTLKPVSRHGHTTIFFYS